MSLESITFHKRTFFPSSSNAFIPNIYNPNQIYFAAGSKLILYDFIESKKIFRINTRGAKIIYLKQSSTDSDIMFILDIDNIIYSFKMSTKEVLCSLQLAKDKKYHKFEIVNNKFIYFVSEEGLFLTKIKIGINDEGKDILEKVKEYQIKISSNNSNSNSKQDIISKKLSSNFIIINDFLIFALNKLLIIYNFLTEEIDQIPFQKKILKIIKTSEDSIALGDLSGKIHFIQDITNKNYILYTKHWHSHAISDLALDPNNDYLYSSGQEGVVVIWNIHTWVKSFLPRLGEPIIGIRVSSDSQNLACFLKNNSIVFINLTKMKIIDTINSISTESLINKFCLFNKRQNFIAFTNCKKGIINLYNISQNYFDFYLNVFNKNFNSKTEREKENNLRVLKLLSFSSPKNEKNMSYMATIEELPYNTEKNLFLSYLKIWQFEKDNIDLIQICENPHNNEIIKNIEGLNFNNYGFLTSGEKTFKVWKLKDKNTNKFICDFEGKYQDRNLLSVTFDNNLVDEYIFALFENKLVIYSKNKIKDIYTLDTYDTNANNYKYNKIYYINSQFISLYGKKDFALFNIVENEIFFEDKICKENEDFFILKIIYQKTEEILNIFVGFENKKDLFYIIKYNINEENLKLVRCLVVEKKNYEYVDLFKKYLVIINNRKEFYLANENELEKEKNMKNKITKEEMDDKDIEL
jgi:WD40 repeat protein